MSPVKHIATTEDKKEEAKLELRLKLVQFGLEQGIRETSRAFQCDRKTVRLWLRRYKEKGLSGLREKSKAPKRIPHKTSIYLEKEVLKAKAKAPLYGPRRLKESFSLGPSVGAIARILKQKGLTKKRRKNLTLEEQKDMPQALSPEIYTDKPKHYLTLGALIKDYRHWRKLSQEALAELIHISTRELRNWEKGRCHSHLATLHDLAEFTGIPMEVCVILNADQPIWYALQERWYAYSSAEMAQYRIKDLIKTEAQPNDGIFAKDSLITTDKQINAILSCHRDIYGTKSLLRKDVINAASMILPQLNRIAFDCWGHYAGHQIILPLTKDVYEQMKKEKNIEEFLTPERISDIIAAREGVFFYYSLFGANSSIGYPMIINDLRFHAALEQKERYSLGVYVIARQQKELCSQSGLMVVKMANENAYKRATLYEVKLDHVWKPGGLFESSLRWVVEEGIGENGGQKNVLNET